VRTGRGVGGGKGVQDKTLVDFRQHRLQLRSGVLEGGGLSIHVRWERMGDG
jgi:hypothetical protein